MAITRWEPLRRWQNLDPFPEIDTLQRQINRLWDRFIPSDSGEIQLGFIPPAEIEETEDAIHLRLEVPGLEAKDIDIQVSPDSVSISGERKSETRVEKQGVTRSEFAYGQFHRVIPLPQTVENDKVEAKYDHGILRLTLPKAEAEKYKPVKVNLG
ncbi:Hsp20/alpha crystallin family protein [Anabaenopsis tanganyikae CS-531]|uniref:Hsp20/alpha crystallin family protein n=2 Tax=Anabaenopsis TaxID=110103 RepID=A0ABT6KH64_9CYAN|nr:MULTISPECIES: Hsp20/alpha crystallin family protein [Anabaenopsis]MDB9539975.1 Hsp20/alpha crystallin family protein [Anabaenopsis arnoldii]MDH6092334.1 Hsp20/alpha crystallin family protein [Anabaenopsis arnoldii]MDH6107173.1 Hsp20/alpha crystallin family protein [Anabaenopsis tanganyikae CS-531]